MDHTATLAPPLPVDPGMTTTIGVTVRNGGPVVERYEVRVLGDAAEWAEPAPPIVVYPGQEEQLVLSISVPQRTVAGEGRSAC